MKLGVVLLALTAVGLFAAQHAGAGGGGFMVSLEVAGDAPTMQARIAAHHASVAVVQTALAWDYLFLVCYGLWTALCASALGRFLGERWDWAGAAAALAGLLAAALDAVENTGMLHALEGGAGAGVAALAARLKFLLIGLALLYVIVAAIAALVRVARDPGDRPLDAPTAGASAQGLLTCDVVMKGGITSGIVYPRAVTRLSQRYRFVNVGGSSAGAIAASATAAAEYARANNRNAFGSLAQLPTWLGQRGHLFNLFRPNPPTRAHFQVITAFLGTIPFAFKLARALAVAAAWFPVSFLLGLLPGALLLHGAYAAHAATSTLTPAWGTTGAVVVSFLAVPLALIAGFAGTLWWKLPRNGFGLCTGRLASKAILSDWLSDLLNDLAGIDKTERPLIFADLWTAGEGLRDVESIRAAARGRAPRDRKINFEALTTSLCHGRPHRMPELGRTFYFRAEELERVLPKAVVKWMVDHPGWSEHPVQAGFLALPAPHDLPVVFAARLSLSFPLLISAVKLWGIDWNHPRNQHREKDAPVHLSPAWMSDGGIASNFPIHFFDALIPGRPTFGLDLSPFSRDSKTRSPDETKNVFLPVKNREGFLESWNDFSGVGGFVGALVDSMQAFLDNMQARAPGFRDRIARIYLDSDEGGLNLDMPGSLIDRLGKRGEVAGDKIIQRFIDNAGWDNHRWIRLRSLLGEIDPLLRDFTDQLAKAPPPDPEPSYEMTAKQRDLAKTVMLALARIGDTLKASDTDLADGQPRPVPELRSSPRV